MSTALAYSIASASAETGLSKSHLTAAIKAGELRSRRSSLDDSGEPVGKYVILSADLQAYLDSLPEA